jgi:hypothetical protein
METTAGEFFSTASITADSSSIFTIFSVLVFLFSLAIS